ncbi:MAG: S9 family peptidase [Bdellovibrionales bacterium]|nr:S9 family peptidase [Bdellovibrionales bacterium]
MRIILTLAVLISLFGCQSPGSKDRTPATALTAAEIPLEEFFKNPALFGFRVSPDGKKLAFLKPWKSRLNIFVQPIDNPSAVKQVTFVEDRDITQIHWKGSNFVLFEKDSNGDENDHVFAVDLTSGEAKDLTPHAGTKAAIIDSLEETSPTDILVQHNQRNNELFDVYRVNVATGASKMVAENKNQILGWLIDHNGDVRGGTSSDGVNTVIYFERSKGKPWIQLYKTNFRVNFTPIGFTADNKRLFVTTNLRSDLDQIVEVDPQRPPNRFIVRTVFKHPKYDVSEAHYSHPRKTLGRVTVVTDRRETFFLNPAEQKEWDFLRAKFPQAGGLVIANSSLDERFWSIKTNSDLTLGSYYIYDRKTKQLTDVGNTSPWLNPELMSPTKTVHYKSRDGLEIEGYLTLPRGSEGRLVPIVINPHGGPWARDEWGFNPETQFLASRGYGVFKMNFRGSTGYGRKFWEKSFKQWGKKMQDDITDGAQWLISQRIADPKRICIYGASYGGYATLAGITFTPDLYACAVDYVGVSNLFTFTKTIPPYWKPMLEMTYEMVGHPEKDKELMRAASPVFHVDKIKTPLFVAQGANDPRVNKAESDQIVEALRSRGVEVEYMVKDNEGHGFANEENRFDFYRSMEKFLGKHLGGRE